MSAPRFATAGRPAPWVVALARAIVLPLARVFHRAAMDGVEHLPSGAPFLLVANHSAGLGVSEILSFLALYLRDVGPERPLAGFALPLMFEIPVASRLVRALGAIPSTYEDAASTLAAGVPILVFPGGSHETLRPIWDTHSVDFGGHRGFLRVAWRAGVPIVPMGIRGGHPTAPVLFRAGWLATALVVPRLLLRQKRWGLSLLGLIGAVGIGVAVPASWPVRALLCWLWLASPITFLPWIPWTLRFRIGAPISPAALFGSAVPEDEHALSVALDRVQSAVLALTR